MADEEFMKRSEPVILEGKDKEIYLKNMQKAFNKLNLVLGSTEVDASLSDYAKKISRTAKLFQYRTGKEDPKENIGVYKEMPVDKRSGFPTMDHLILFSANADTADSELQKLGYSTKDFSNKAIDVLMNYEAGFEAERILEECNDKVRNINFLNRLKVKNFENLPDGAGTRVNLIDLIGENDEVENFNMFYSGWDMSKLFFAAYSFRVDDDKEKYMKIGPEKPGHVFQDDKNSPWVASKEVNDILYSSFGLHPEHYFGALNKLEGIHPQKISYLGIENFETAHVNKNFGDILEKHPESGILVATTITIKGRTEEGEGKTRQTVFDPESDREGKLYVLCSESTKSEVIEWYKHNKYVDFNVVPY